MRARDRGRGRPTPKRARQGRGRTRPRAGLLPRFPWPERSPAGRRANLCDERDPTGMSAKPRPAHRAGGPTRARRPSAPPRCRGTGPRACRWWRPASGTPPCRTGHFERHPGARSERLPLPLRVHPVQVQAGGSKTGPGTQGVARRQRPGFGAGGSHADNAQRASVAVALFGFAPGPSCCHARPRA